jgi:hypothetical protein
MVLICHNLKYYTISILAIKHRRVGMNNNGEEMKMKNNEQIREIIQESMRRKKAAAGAKLATVAVGAGGGVATCAVIGKAGLVVLGGGVCLSYGAFALVGGVIALGVRGLFK